MKADFPFSSHPHQELCAEMESKFHTYTDVRNAIHRMLESSDVVRGSSTEHSLSILEQKWASVYSKIQERKVVWPSVVMCPPVDSSLMKRVIISECYGLPAGKAHRRPESGKGLPQHRPGASHQDEQVWGVCRASSGSQLCSGHCLYSTAGTQSRFPYAISLISRLTCTFGSLGFKNTIFFCTDAAEWGERS